MAHPTSPRAKRQIVPRGRSALVNPFSREIHAQMTDTQILKAVASFMPQTVLARRPAVVLKRAKQCAFHAATSKRSVTGKYGQPREFESERQSLTRALRLPANAKLLAALRPSKPAASAKAA